MSGSLFWVLELTPRNKAGRPRGEEEEEEEHMTVEILVDVW